MQTNTAVINAGIELVNKGKQARLEQEVAALVTQICGELAAIKMMNETIKLEQNSLNALRKDLITQDDVFGGQITDALNQNEVTIIKVIGDLNRDKQGRVELKSQVHVQRIDQGKDAIAERTKRIVEIRGMLGKLTLDAVTTAEVLG
jgi:hypothetical protein